MISKEHRIYNHPKIVHRRKKRKGIHEETQELREPKKKKRALEGSVKASIEGRGRALDSPAAVYAGLAAADQEVVPGAGGRDSAA